MLSRITLYLNTSQLNVNNSSLFQGALMEMINPQYAEFLHRSELKPYTQYLTCRENECVWTVQTLNKEAYNEIIEKPRLGALKEIYLRHLDFNIEITNSKVESISKEELIEQTFFSVCPRMIKLRFKTPCSFKVAGSYRIYPTIEHIFHSLISKYDKFSEFTQISDDRIIEDFTENICVAGYNLRSTRFALEGVKIPSFSGTLLLKINGPQQLVNLAHLLLRYGAYSGAGIKTAIGMGALEILDRKETKNG